MSNLNEIITPVESDIEPYTEIAFMTGGRATRVPSKKERDAMRRTKPYGIIKQGVRISGDENKGTYKKVPLEATPEQWTNKKLRKQTPEQTTSDIPEGSVEDVEELTEKGTYEDVLDDLEEELEEIVESPTKEKASKKEELPEGIEAVLKRAIADLLPKKQTPLPQPINNVKVTLEGSFGKYRGNYRDVYVSENFVVLVYDEDCNIYSPVSSTEPFNLVHKGISYQVYFLGIEFDMPCIKGGVQVMIRYKDVDKQQ